MILNETFKQEPLVPIFVRPELFFPFIRLVPPGLMLYLMLNNFEKYDYCYLCHNLLVFFSTCL